tara:strand:- start:167 stop:562 length:396 start_codon:yes stop_codon:yes gene_type:complete
MLRLNTKNKTGSNKNFGLFFGFIFIIIAFWPLLGGGGIRFWSLSLSLIFFLLALLKPESLKILNYAWISFGNLLGRIVSPIVMGLIFFIVITPIGLIMRIFKKDLLNMKFSNQKSYWIDRKVKVGSMRKQF